MIIIYYLEVDPIKSASCIGVSMLLRRVVQRLRIFHIGTTRVGVKLNPVINDTSISKPLSHCF